MRLIYIVKPLCLESSFLVLHYCFFFCGFGAQMANILFPSIFGIPSRTPVSLSLSANFNSNNSPLSLN